MIGGGAAIHGGRPSSQDDDVLLECRDVAGDQAVARHAHSSEKPWAGPVERFADAALHGRLRVDTDDAEADAPQQHGGREASDARANVEGH
jgi:hypothetical protein